MLRENLFNGFENIAQTAVVPDDLLEIVDVRFAVAEIGHLVAQFEFFRLLDAELFEKLRVQRLPGRPLFPGRFAPGSPRRALNRWKPK